MLSRPGGLRRDQLDAERVSELARYLVLQGEQIACVAIEALGPQMRVALGSQLAALARARARWGDETGEGVT